jgi:hypothetical protein
MNTATKLGVALALAVSLAGSMSAQTAPKKKKAKAKAIAAKPVVPPVTQADVQSLKDTMAAQQQAIEALKSQLAQRDQNWQDAQQKLQAAQSAAAEAQSRAAAVEAGAAQDREAYNHLASDMTDVKTTLTNSALNTIEDQKRFTAFETALNRFKFTGDVRVRGENFNQQGAQDRNRERIRARFGFEGKVGDFTGGLSIATGSLGDPTSTNETLTNNFDRKTIGLDRAFVTYNPSYFKPLQLTGGKFAYTWTRTGVTFDPDINPEGGSEKLSFDLHNPVFKNVSVGAYELAYNESGGGQDSYALGAHGSVKLQPLPFWTATASFSATKWNRQNAILSASAFALQATSASAIVQLPIFPAPVTGPTTTPVAVTINLPGEGQGCSNPKITQSQDANGSNLAKPVLVPFSPNCVFAPNGMTNSLLFDVTTDGFGTITKKNLRFASGFFYTDFILANTFKTPFKRLPINVTVEYENNLDAVAHPYSSTLDPITSQLVQLTNLGKQSHAYYGDISVGQQVKKGDFQIGYAWLRQEQDSAIASFVESDQRAPTNILQHRFYALYRLNPNTTAGFTFWRGRTLNTALENAVLSPGITAGQTDHFLNRMQFDIIYSF